MEQTTDQNGQNQEWVIFEAMGHVRVAGRYYFENGLHRIDIPDPAEIERYRTERFGSGSVYRITSVDELTARTVARQCVIPDAIPWDIRRELKQLTAPGETIEQMEGDFGPDVTVQEYGEDDDRFDPDDIPF